jgi:hypothetical protein
MASEEGGDPDGGSWLAVPGAGTAVMTASLDGAEPVAREPAAA